MNHTYKTLYNTALGAWVAVPETARNHGKTKSVKTAAVAIAVAGALFSPTAAQAASWTWGNNAQAPGADSIAMGDDSNANTKFSVALGTQAQNKTNGDSTIVIGYQAQTMTDVNPNTATNTMGQQVVIGEASVANSQSVALGAQVRATGQASIAIGGDDLGNNDSKTSAGKYTGGESWRNYAGQPITVEGVSTKDAAATGFIRTTSSGRGSIAVGHMGQSTGKASVAIGADSHAEADGAIATGMASQAKGVASVATGIGATAGARGAIATGLKAAATGTDAIATGTGARAGARNDVAIGHDAGAVSGAATTGERVMIGANATVGANQNLNVAAGGTFGSINLTTKTANQSVAIGGGSGEDGRRTYAYGDQSLAIGSDTLAYGDGSVAIGGDDLDQAGNQQTTYTDPNSGNQVNGTVRQAYNALTGDTMNSGVYAKTVSKQAAVAVGVQAQAADLGVALGAKSGATKTNSVAIGTGAQATLDNAVAIGGGSKTLDAGTKQESTTINGTTYRWAGGGKTLPGDIVSFGSKDYERQLKHVAAGKVSADSTDAINGSQLYAVAEKTQTHYYSVKSTETGTDSNYANDGATGSNSLAAGAKAKASAMNTVAVGYNAQATNDSAVAVGANTEATNASTALGDSSKAKGKNSTALGWNANAVGEADVFIGKQAGGNTMNVGNSRNIGIGEGAISNVGNTKVSNIIGIGTGAAAGMQGDHNIALGAYANGTENGAAAVTTTNNVAIGERTRASGGNAIAIGARGTKAEGLAAIALGVGADAKGQNGVAAGQNTVASASGTVAIGGSANAGNGATASGVQAVAIGQLSKASGNKTTALGAEANASGLNSTALGTGASTAGGLGGLNAVAVGAKASANAGSTTAVGAAAQASGVNAAAFGAGAQAGTKGTAVGYNAVVTHNGAIALGADSVSTATFGAVPNATINGITYGNFAAANVNATVSVGSAGNERAITNVGAGRINANSTDAINGSQLYAITNQLQAGQTHYYSVNDGGTRGSNYNNDGATAANTLAAGVNAKARSSNSVAMGDGAETANSVNAVGKGLNVAIGSNAKIKSGIRTNGSIKGSWEATAIGADTVAEGVRTTAVGYGASATEYYATAIGYKSSAPEWHALAIGSQATVAPTATTDVAAAQAITTNLTNVRDASKSAAAIAIGRQATAAGYGAIAQGLNTQATTAYATAIGANAKASKVGSTAFGAYAVAEADSSVALGRYSHADREKLEGSPTLGADPLGVGAQAGSLTWQSNAGAVSVGSSNNRNYAGVDVPKTTRQIINLAAGSADTDAVNVAQLKAAGFNLAVSQSGGTSADNTVNAADKKINNGKTLTFDAGNGIDLQQDGGKITIATNAQAITDNAQLPVVYTKADGSKVYKRGNKFYDAPVGGNEVAAADVIASMQNAAGSTTAPTVLANVASNLADASSVTSNPANNARGDFANKGNNAATVKDVLNAGFNVQGNGAAKDFVTHGDTINFANGRGTVANVESQNGVTTVKFDTPLEYVGGTPTAPATNTVKLVGGDASQPVALQNVAAGTNDTDAVNVSQLNAVKTTANKGFKIAGNSKANGITMDNETIKPDETLTVKGTGTGTFATDYNSDNIQTQVSGDGTITIGLKKDIAVNSVTATDGTNTTVTRPTGTVTSDGTGNTTATTANGVKATDTNGNTTSLTQTGITTTDSAGNTTAVNSGGVTISKPGKDVVSLTGDGLNNGNNKITHVKAGEADTDAVNVSQLKKAADAAKTKVVEGDGIKVAETKNTDGSSTYKVSADTAPITTVNNKAATAGNNKQLATAQDVVNAVNNSGFILKSSANGGEKDAASSGDEVIKPGSTVDMAAGKNMKVKQEANGKITYSTKDEVEFDKVTVGGVVIDKNNGINAGNKKIANVANGTGDKDAVNVSQLKGAADAFGGNAGINTDGTFRAPSYNLVDGKPADNKPPRTYNNVGDALGALNTAVTSPLTFGGDSGSNFDRKLGSQVYVKGGATGALSDNNIGVVSDGNNTLNVKLAKDVNVQSVTTTDAAGNKTVTDGNGVTITPAGGGNPVSLTNTGLNNGGNKITNVADGVADSDAANVKQVKAARTEVKAGTNIASVDKTQANDGHDIYTVNAKGTTVSGAGDVIVTATNSGDNVTNYQVSLSGGVKQDIGKGVQAYDIVTTQGIRFGGDTGVTNVHKLGDTMMIMGDQNVKTAADVDGIHMRLNPDVNVNSVTTGDTKMSDEGVAIKNGPALTKQGISAGNLPIRNVAPGRIAPDSRDAVNGAQLHALGRYVDNVDKRAKAGTASAIATAGLPQAYRPGASMVAAAGGYYDGQSAVAIGVSTISDNGRWVIKGAANVNSKEAGATIGIGYQW